MRIETPGGDDTALNSIALTCTDKSGRPAARISPHPGYWGSWGDTVSCSPGAYLTRFSLKVEAPQGSGDDTAANAVKFTCDNGAALEARGSQWGTYGAWAGGFANSAICGVRALIEPKQGSGDDTPLNDLEFFWCSMNNSTVQANSAIGNWKFVKTIVENAPNCPGYVASKPNCFEVTGTVGRVDKGGDLVIKSDRTAAGNPPKTISYRFQWPGIPTVLVPGQTLLAPVRVTRVGMTKTYNYSSSGSIGIGFNQVTSNWNTGGRPDLGGATVRVSDSGIASQRLEATIPGLLPLYREDNGTHRMAVFVTVWAPNYRKTLRHVYEFSR